MGRTRNGQEFRNFLQQVGLIPPSGGPVLPGPSPFDAVAVPPPVIPRYENGPMRGRGGIDGPPLNRQYVAPLPLPEPEPYVPIQGPEMPSAPPTNDQLLNLFQTAPFQTYAPPGTIGNEQMNLMWQLANDPELVRQVNNNRPISETLLDTTSDIGKGAYDFLTSSAAEKKETVGEAVTGTGRDAANLVLDIYEAPMEKRKSMTGDLIYQEATGQYDAFDQESMTLNWESLVGMDPRVFGLPTVFQPASAVRTPEQKEEVTRIYEAAEAQGQDGGAAVWEWYIGQFPAWQRALTEAGGDPLNYPLALTPVGNAIIRGAPNAGRLAPVVRTVGNILKAPEVIADAPFEVPAAIVRAAGWRGRTAGKLVPDAVTNRGPLASSQGQLERDAQEELIRQGRVANSLMKPIDENTPSPYLNRAERMTAEQTAAREAAIAAEAERRVIAEGGILPKGDRRLIPGDVGPAPTPVQQAPPVTTVADETDDIIARANALRSNGTQVGPTPVETQPSATIAPSNGLDDYPDEFLGHPMRQTGTAVDNATGETFRVYQNADGTAHFLVGNRGTEMGGSGNPGNIDGFAFTSGADTRLASSAASDPSVEVARTDTPPPVRSQPGVTDTFRVTTMSDAQLRAEQDRIAQTIDVTDPNADPSLVRRYDSVIREIDARKSGQAEQVVMDYSADPSVEVARTDTPPPVRSQPETTMPTQDADPVEFFFRPSKDGNKATDVLAREQPHVFPRVVDDVKPWVETRYQTNRNLLTKDALSPEREAMRQLIPGAEPYMAPPKNPNAKSYVRYQGMNKALSQILDAEAFGRIRLSTYLNGGNLDNIRWTIDPKLLDNRLVDRPLATLLKIPLEKTRSGLTKESVMAHYLVNTNPEADAAYLKWLTDNGVFRTEPGVTPEEQRAFARYTYAQTVKPWATGDTAVLDEIIAAQGLQKQPVVVNPADAQRMPAVQDIVARGDTWTADRFDTIARLPDEVKAPIYAEVAPWAEDAYRNIAVTSPRLKAFTDLEFAAELRESAARHGVALQTPTQPVTYDPNDLASVVRAAVQEPDAARAEQIIDALVAGGHARREPPVSYLQSYDPPLYYKQMQQYDTFQRISDLRLRLNRPAGEIVNLAENTVQAPIVGPRLSELPPQRTVSQKDFQKRIDAEIKRIRKEWAADPTKGAPTTGDNLLAIGEAEGMLAPEEVAFIRQQITIITGTRKNPVKRVTTVFDLFVEESMRDTNITVADAVRKVEAIIAESNRLAAPENRIKSARTVGKKAGTIYDKVTKTYRDVYLYNPASVVRNGFVDGLASSMTQMMEGHVKSGLKSIPFINPKAHLALYKHNMTGADLQHEALKAAKNWDVHPGAGVIDVVTRELDQIGDVTFAKVPVVGGMMKRGQAGRHTFDQNNRANLWADEFGRQLKTALYGGNDPGFLNAALRDEMPSQGFYDRVIGVLGGGQKADDAVAALREIELMGGFTPADVKRITGSTELMHDWRRTSRAVGKSADKEVNRVFFSYRQTNADFYTRRVFMFHYWMSRALVQHTRLTLSNPLLLYRYTQIWEGMDREAKRQGLDGPMAPLQMYFEYMRGDGGMFGISNPIAVFTPFSMFADAMTSYGNETGWDKFWRSTGAFLLPQIQAAAVIMGVSQRYPDFLGTASLRRTIRQLIDWDRNNGYGIFGLLPGPYGEGPGITGDPVQHYFNRTIERMNAIVRELLPEVENVSLPGMEKPQEDVAIAIMIENAEQDFGVPIGDMTPDQLAEIESAKWAIRYGAQDNERANEAIAEMTQGNWNAAKFNWWLPGGMRARSEYYEDTKETANEYYNGENLTPAVDHAFDVMSTIQSGSPEVSALENETEQLREIGTPLEKAWYDGFNEIAYSQNLDPNGFVMIAGRIYRGYEMNQMSSENRLKLAKAWLLDNGSNEQWLESYKGKRDAFTAGQDQLPDYRQYQKDAGKYEGGETYTYEGVKQTPVYQGGGIRAMREDLEGGDPAMTNPNFARAIGEERERLIGKGLTGEELEEALDMWAISPEGYNAYRGRKNRQNDPEPLPLSLDPTNIPPSIAQPAEEGGTGGGGSPASSGSSGVKERKMPEWQVDLVNEWTAYSQAVTDFEAAYGEGAMGNYRFNPQVLDKYIPKPSGSLKKYLEWAAERQAKSQPYSIEDYLAFRDAEYEAEKEQDKADREQAEATLGRDSTPETVEELLDDVDKDVPRKPDPKPGKSRLPTPKEVGKYVPFPTYIPPSS